MPVSTRRIRVLAPPARDPRARLLTVFDEWRGIALMTGLLRKNTLEQYGGSLELFARAGVRTLGEATPHAVRGFMRERLAAGRSPETCNRNLAALTSMLTWLHAEGRFDLGQLLELRQLFLERPRTPRPDFITLDEYEQLRASARAVDPKGRFELMVALGVEAGLRFHEARQLHAEDLDLEGPAPFLRVSMTHGRRNKTDRERTVPIRIAFANELWRRRFEPGPIFRARARRGEDLLSPYVHRGTFREWRESSFERAGGRWEWHLLRHTFASWHVQAGVSIAKVAAWMGNSIQVCMRHYAALIPGGDRDVERAFSPERSLLAHAASCWRATREPGRLRRGTGKRPTRGR